MSAAFSALWNSSNAAGASPHIRIAAAQQVVGEHAVVGFALGGVAVVVVADAAHQGGVACCEDGVALVLGIGAQEVVASKRRSPRQTILLLKIGKAIVSNMPTMAFWGMGL